MKTIITVLVALFFFQVPVQVYAQACSWPPTLPPVDQWSCGGVIQPFCGSIDPDGEPRSIQVALGNLSRPNTDPLQSGDNVMVTQIADRMPQGFQDTVWMRSCLPAGVAFQRFLTEPCAGQVVPRDTGGKAYLVGSDRVIGRVWGRTKCADPMLLTYEVLVTGSPGEKFSWLTWLVRTDDVRYLYALTKRVSLEIGKPITP